MKIPKSEKGLSNQISRILAKLSAFKETHGFIHDGSGERYYLFYLHFLLGDNEKSSDYIQWYEKEFPNDRGEPFALLCWPLILHRMGKGGEKQLAEAMLSNLYLIPFLLGEKIERIDMWHPSSDSDPELMDYFPKQLSEAISEDDLAWIRDQYQSEPFKELRGRYTEIYRELKDLPVGDRRSALVKEAFSLLDGWE